MKKRHELGIEDQYELNAARCKAALDLLRGQRKLVAKYRHDAFVQIDDVTNEGVVASSSSRFRSDILKGQIQPVATVVPVEGSGGERCAPRLRRVRRDQLLAHAGEPAQDAGSGPNHRRVNDGIAILGGG